MSPYVKMSFLKMKMFEGQRHKGEGYLCCFKAFYLLRSLVYLDFRLQLDVKYFVKAQELQQTVTR